MGHYDSCYAHDDYTKMSKWEKRKVFMHFAKEYKKNGSVHRTYDDVYGWLLHEWAKEKGLVIHNHGLHDIEVDDKHTKEEVIEMLKPKKPLFDGLMLPWK